VRRSPPDLRDIEIDLDTMRVEDLGVEFVRQSFADPQLVDFEAPECEQNVIDDLAGQFEEAYRDAIASGLSDTEATTAAMAHVTDWRELARQIA